MAPFHAESLGDMWLYLAAEPQDESALGVRLQVPANVCKGHGVAGKGDSDARDEINPLSGSSTQRQRQERIVGDLDCDDAIKTCILCPPYRRRCIGEIPVNDRIGLHGAILTPPPA